MFSCFMCIWSLSPNTGVAYSQKEILEDLKDIFSEVCIDFKAKLEEFDGEDDHVYLLVTYPPKVAISHMVNSLKGVSSRLICKRNIPLSSESFGGNLYGCQATLQEVVKAHLYPS